MPRTKERPSLGYRLTPPQPTTGVDLILGHHVQVVQPIERVGAKWVAYSMGNSLSNQTPSCCAAGAQDGVLVKVTVAEDGGRLRVRQLRYMPTWVEHPSFRIRPCSPPWPTERSPCSQSPCPGGLPGPDQTSCRPTVRPAPTG
jgi:Bacterial capsule synthesis protein PGA_cap